MPRYYVGRAQWVALCALDNAIGGALRIEQLRFPLSAEAVKSQAGAVVAALLRAGMVRHACPCDDHSERDACLIAITEHGRGARLDRRGRMAAGATH